MCLDIKSTQRKDKEGYFLPNIAKKDIICYKWVERTQNKTLKTPYQLTIVKVGQVMKAELGICTSSTDKGIVNEGIHAYTNKKNALEATTVIECIIPKGSQYIKGKYSEIVANKMKLKRRIIKGKL